MDICAFWDAVLRQDADAIRSFFHPEAWVNWHNTNEHFTLEEYIRANCEYPGTWVGEVGKVISMPDQIITVTHVYNKEGTMSCHSVSFIRVAEGKIAAMDEYWGDDGEAPRWRQELGIGKSLHG